MKKSLISLAVLQASAALAAATANSNLALAATAQKMKRDPKAGNDEHFKPQGDESAVKFADVRPIHIDKVDRKPRNDEYCIGGGCSSGVGEEEHVTAIPTSRHPTTFARALQPASGTQYAPT